MTMPILSTTTPVDGTAGHLTTALPTEGEVATIAAEFRTAMSNALGGTIRSRRGRADGPRETAAPPSQTTIQGHVEALSFPTAATGASWPMPSKDAELLAENVAEDVAGAPSPETPRPRIDEPSTSATLTVAVSNGERAFAGDEVQRANDLPVPVADHGAASHQDVTALPQGTLTIHAWPTLAAATVAPADAATATHTSYGGRASVEPRDIAASDLARTLGTTGTAILRDRTLLHPEFDARLGRVLDRMESEYGFTVEVVETHRTQQRQDTLFAQGRSAPGPIVTWTRQSNHTDGLAADVTVNGGWSDKAGFERLARVAKEEGLATLWPRDPGHIELPRASHEGSHREANDTVPVPRLAPVGVRRPETGNHPVSGDFRALPVSEGVLRMPSINEDLAGTHPIALDDVTILPMPGGSEGRRIRETRIRALTEAVLGETPAARPGLAPPDDSAVDLIRDLTPRPLAAIEGRPAPQVPNAIATVARVAEVASIATVAKVAQVQAPGTGAPRIREAEGTSRREPGARRTPADELSSVLGSLVHEGEERPTLQTEHTHSRVATPTRPVVPASIIEREPRVELSQDRESMLSSDVAPELLTERPQPVFTMDRVTETRSERTGAGIDAITRTDATERIARALKLQDAQQEMPVSSLTLRLDHPEGGEDRIRIDLRGSTIGARLDIADPVAAEHVRLHTNELQHALESRGLDGETIAVRSMTRLAEPNQNAAAIAGSEREGLRASNTQGGQSSAQGQTRDQRQSSRGEDLSRDSHHSSSRQQRDARGNRR